MAANVGRYEMIFQMKGSDQATQVLRKVDKSFKDTARQANKAGGSFKKTGDEIGGTVDQMVGRFIPGGSGAIKALNGMASGGGMAGAGMLKLAGGVAAAVAALFAFRERAQEVAFMESRMQAIAGTVAGASVEFRKMQIASSGAFSFKDIANAQARVQAFNLPLKLTPEIMKAVQARAVMMGTTVEFAMESLTLGLARGSRKILDNLAIMIKIGDVERNYAESIGKTVDALTEQEKKVALVNEAEKQLMSTTSQVGGGATEFQRIGALLSDMGDDLFSMLIPVFKALRQALEFLAPIIEFISGAFRGMFNYIMIGVGPVLEVFVGISRVLGDMINPWLTAAVEILGNLGNAVTGYIKKGFDDVSEIVLSWAEGIGKAVEKFNKLGRWLAETLHLRSKHADAAAKLQAIERERDKDLGPRREAAEKEYQIALKNLEARNKFLPIIKKHNLDIAKTLAASKKTLVEQESKLLEIKATNGSLSDQELGRLAALRRIMKIEAMTAGLKREILANEEAMTKQIQIQGKIATSTGALTPDEVKDLKEAETAYFAITARAEELKVMLSEVHLEAEKPIDMASLRDEMRKLRAGAGGGGGGEVGETAADIKAKMDLANQELAIQALQNRQREIDIKLMSEQNEEIRIHLQYRKDILAGQIKGIQGQKQESDFLKREADIRGETALRALDASEKKQASERQEKKTVDELAQAQRELQQSLSILANMSSQYAGNDVAVMGTAMGGLANVANNLEKGQIGVSEAIAGSGGVVAAAAGHFIESQEAIAAIQAAFELAAGFAATGAGNVPAAVAHFTASALFGLIASGVGGGGDAAAASGDALQKVAEDVDRDKQAGDRQIVINISGIVTDPQGVGSTIKRTLEAMEGTGF